MPRPAGAKNKPKNAQALLDRVIAEYKKQGKKLSTSIEDIADLSEADKSAVAEQIASNPELNIANIFELEGEEGEEGDNANDNEDTYICGACKRDIGEPLTHCPYCGVKLNWEE